MHGALRQYLLIVATWWCLSAAQVRGGPLTPTCGTQPAHGTSATTPPQLRTIAGGPQGDANSPGNPLASAFQDPKSLLVLAQSGVIVICDRTNHKVKFLTPAGETLTAAGGAIGYKDDTDPLQAQFNQPFGLAYNPLRDSLLVTEKNNHRIREIQLRSPTTLGPVTTIAGDGSVGQNDGSAISATFNGPRAVCFSAFENTAYIGDADNDVLRKLDMTTATVATLPIPPGAPASRNPFGCVIDETNGDLYSNFNDLHAIVHRAAEESDGGALNYFAGSSTATPGYADDIGTAARFNKPNVLAGNWIHRVLYVADLVNNRLRQVDIASRLTSTLAGTGVSGGANGALLSAQLSRSSGMWYDAASGALVFTHTTPGQFTVRAAVGLHPPCVPLVNQPGLGGVSTTPTTSTPPPSGAQSPAPSTGLTVLFEVADDAVQRFVSLSGVPAADPSTSYTLVAGSGGFTRRSATLDGAGSITHFFLNGTAAAAQTKWYGAGTAAGVLAGPVTGLSQERDGRIYLVCEGAPAVYRYHVASNRIERIVGNSVTNANAPGVGPAATLRVPPRSLFSIEVDGNHRALHLIGVFAKGTEPAVLSTVRLPDGPETQPDAGVHVPLDTVKVPQPAALHFYHQSAARDRPYLLITTFSPLQPLWRVALDDSPPTATPIPVNVATGTLLITAIASEGAGQRWAYAADAGAMGPIIVLSWNQDLTAARVFTALNDDVTDANDLARLTLPMLTSFAKVDTQRYVGSVGLELGELRSFAVQFQPSIDSQTLNARILGPTDVVNGSTPVSKVLFGEPRRGNRTRLKTSSSPRLVCTRVFELSFVLLVGFCFTF